MKCPDINAARLLDYGDKLDRWVHGYAWVLCGGDK